MSLGAERRAGRLVLGGAQPERAADAAPLRQRAGRHRRRDHADRDHEGCGEPRIPSSHRLFPPLYERPLRLPEIEPGGNGASDQVELQQRPAGETGAKPPVEPVQHLCVEAAAIVLGRAEDSLPQLLRHAKQVAVPLLPHEGLRYQMDARTSRERYHWISANALTKEAAWRRPRPDAKRGPPPWIWRSRSSSRGSPRAGSTGWWRSATPSSSGSRARSTSLSAT